MEVIDLKKQLKPLYQPSAKSVDVVDVPPMNFLMVDGEGDPNTSQAFSDAIEALFALSYTVKFMIKKGPMAIDYGVMPLEGLWWADDMTKFSSEDKSNWKWTVMIMQPSFATQEIIEDALVEVKKRKKWMISPKCDLNPFRKGNARKQCTLARFPMRGQRSKSSITSLTLSVIDAESIMKFI